jgi:hypothetical protein
MSSYPLNLPDSLKRAAQLRAKRDGVSLNQWIAAAVAEKVGAMNAIEFFSERAVGADATGKRLLDLLGRAPDREPDESERLP